MQAVEFEATIENGIVQIPKKYKALQNNIKATFVVMYDNMKTQSNKKETDQELDMLFSLSNNKTQVTMKQATQTDGMMDDGIL
jgi:hypothetical protein